MSSHREAEDRVFIRQLATDLKRQWWFWIIVIGGVGAYMALSGKEDQPVGLMDLAVVVGFIFMALSALIIMCTEAILKAISRNHKTPD